MSTGSSPGQGLGDELIEAFASRHRLQGGALVLLGREAHHELAAIALACGRRRERRAVAFNDVHPFFGSVAEFPIDLGLVVAGFVQETVTLPPLNQTAPRAAKPLQTVPRSGGPRIESILERYDDFDDIGHMTVPVLTLCAICCLVIACAGTPHVVRYLWDDGFLPMLLTCVVIPGTLWAACIAIKGWVSERLRRH